MYQNKKVEAVEAAAAATIAAAAAKLAAFKRLRWRNYKLKQTAAADKIPPRAAFKWK